MSEERHSFVTPGLIDRDAFVQTAVHRTTEDAELRWHVHGHSHAEWGTRDCNIAGCMVISQGTITRMDELTQTGTTAVE